MNDFDFDQRAREWDSDPVKVERARVVAAAIRAAVPLDPGLRALEYGCGTGLLSFALQADLGAITLADTSAGMLEVLGEKIRAAGVTNMRPVRLDLSADPLPAERFGLVYSLMTLHHIPDTSGLLQRFHDLLDAPGVLCVADLEKEDGSFHGPGFDGHLGFERPALQAQAEAAGFRRVRFAPVYTMHKTVDGVRREYPLFLMVAEKE
jgi:ubiquinone/menaquinone biosynthesis C-methylase UbiE